MRKRLRRIQLTPQQYFLVASVAMGTLVLIVFTGAAVRVTGSGLGCPDWPNCYEDGRLTPELGTHSYIEFGNRMLTSVVGISAVARVRALVRAPAIPARPRAARGAAAGSACSARP